MPQLVPPGHGGQGRDQMARKPRKLPEMTSSVDLGDLVLKSDTPESPALLATSAADAPATGQLPG
ncbi:hypothetical protein GCM10009754_87170 [Amycolatopsis minnesotensis]|uniref:Uncharacterized protein n=1 Tax=Amycolatopsis minnesotensis TaxID=337894 RepID=A0ABN2SXN0_9PSEU